MSLEEKTREGIRSLNKINYGEPPFEEPGMSMKVVAKKHISCSFHLHEDADENDKHFNKFVADLDDDPMPAAFKRVVMRKVKTMLLGCEDTDEEMCPSHMGMRICRFGP